VARLFDLQGALIVIAQNFFVRRQPRQQQIGREAALHPAVLRQVAGGLLQQINAQQFAAQRQFVRQHLRCFVLPRSSHSKCFQIPHRLGAIPAMELAVQTMFRTQKIRLNRNSAQWGEDPMSLK